VNDEDKRMIDEMRWLMGKSDGVVGLTLDGSVTPWEHVTYLYIPTWREFLRRELDRTQAQRLSADNQENTQ
jgi:hypothetical protein